MDVDLALLALIVVFAFMINATTGFGGSLITVTLGIHFYPVEFLIPVVVMVNLTISVYIAARHHTGVDLGLLLRQILPFSLLGIPLGLVMFHVVKGTALEIALGIFVVCFSLLELALIFWGRAPRKPLSPGASAAWLFSGGVMHGLYATGGPLIVYYAGRNIPDKRVFRSTLSALWVILNAVLLASHLSTGDFTAESAWTWVVLLPALAVGIAAGEWLHFRLPERSFRIFVFSILAAAGVTILV
jgi:uncharacterized protein